MLTTRNRSGQVNPSKGMSRDLRTLLRAPSAPTRKRPWKRRVAPPSRVATAVTLAVSSSTPVTSLEKSTSAPAIPASFSYSSRLSLNCSHWSRYGCAVTSAIRPKSNSAMQPARSRYWRVGALSPMARKSSSTPVAASMSRVGGWKVEARQRLRQRRLRLQHGHRHVVLSQVQRHHEPHGSRLPPPARDRRSCHLPAMAAALVGAGFKPARARDRAELPAVRASRCRKRPCRTTAGNRSLPNGAHGCDYRKCGMTCSLHTSRCWNWSLAAKRTMNVWMPASAYSLMKSTTSLVPPALTTSCADTSS